MNVSCNWSIFKLLEADKYDVNQIMNILTKMIQIRAAENYSHIHYQICQWYDYVHIISIGFSNMTVLKRERGGKQYQQVVKETSDLWKSSKLTGRLMFPFNFSLKLLKLLSFQFPFGRWINWVRWIVKIHIHFLFGLFWQKHIFCIFDCIIDSYFASWILKCLRISKKFMLEFSRKCLLK